MHILFATCFFITSIFCHCAFAADLPSEQNNILTTLINLETHDDYYNFITDEKHKNLDLTLAQCWPTALAEDVKNQDKLDAEKYIDKIKFCLLYQKHSTTLNDILDKHLPHVTYKIGQHKQVYIPYKLVTARHITVSRLGLIYEWNKGQNKENLLSDQNTVRDIMWFHCDQLGNCQTYQDLRDKINGLPIDFPHIIEDPSGNQQDIMIIKGTKKSRVCGLLKSTFIFNFNHKRYLIDNFQLYNEKLVMPHIKNGTTFLDVHMFHKRPHNDDTIHLKQLITLPNNLTLSSVNFIKGDFQLKIDTKFTDERVKDVASPSFCLQLPLQYNDISADQMIGFFGGYLHSESLGEIGHFLLIPNEHTCSYKFELQPLSNNDQKDFLSQGMCALIKALSIQKCEAFTSNYYFIDHNLIKYNDIAAVLHVLAYFPQKHIVQQEYIIQDLLERFIVQNEIKPQQIGRQIPNGWSYDWLGTVTHRTGSSLIHKDKTIIDKSGERAMMFHYIRDKNNKTDQNKFEQAAKQSTRSDALKTYLQSFFAQMSICFCHTQNKSDQICLVQTVGGFINAAYNNTPFTLVSKNLCQADFQDIGNKDSFLKTFGHDKFMITGEKFLYFFVANHKSKINGISALEYKKIPKSDINVENFEYHNDNGQWTVKESRNFFIDLFQSPYRIYKNDATDKNNAPASSIKQLTPFGKICLGLFCAALLWNIFIINIKSTNFASPTIFSLFLSLM